MSQAIRVLVVDDSALMRHRLGAIVGGAEGFEVAGIAINGVDCLRQMALVRPDVITLDVDMPELNGLDTLRRIMAEQPTPVLMVSALTASGAQTTLDALALGAVDYLAKPSFLSTSSTNPFSIELLTKLRMAGQIRPAQLTTYLKQQQAARPTAQRMQLATPGVASRPPTLTGQRGTQTPLVVIGSSTGGPQALDQLFTDLQVELPSPLLIVQHMPPVFTRSLAVRIARRSGFCAQEVEGGEQLNAGNVYVAQGGKHLTLGSDRRLHLDQTEPLHGVRPSVDRTLFSVAEHWRGPCLVVILTGMGVDGTAGIRAMRPKGVTVYAQDEATSIVYGMPRSVVEAGLATTVLPLEKIGGEITDWAQASSARSEVKMRSAANA